METKTATKPSVSLCLIVKNEEKTLPVVLASAAEFVDEIIIVDTGSDDKTKQIAEDFGAKVFDFAWTDNFSAARNFSFSKATKDWILWLDADDTLVGGQKMVELLSSLVPSTGGVMAQYEYAFDESGRCCAIHTKVRLCKNDGTYIWKGRIHEDLVPIGASEVIKTDVFHVRHMAEGERVKESSKRNLEVALKEYAENNKDPRIIFNVANSYLSLGKFEEAIRKYLEYIPLSGWDEEIYIAYCRIAHCLILLEQLDEAKNMFLRALKIQPRYAESYRGLAHIAMWEAKFEDAEEYLKMTIMKSRPDSCIVWNPYEYEVLPFYELAQVYMKLNRIGEAIEANAVFLQKSPGDKRGLKLEEELAVLQKELEYRDGYLKVLERLDQAGDKEAISRFIESLSSDYASDPAVCKVRNKYFVKKESSGHDMAIFCGMAFEEWGPASLEKGVGGSEEAVIRLSREFAKKGWDVSVYNNCGIKPIYDNFKGEANATTIGPGSVTYRPFWEFNPEDKNDVFISWRNPIVFDIKINAPIRLLDLHDVPSPMDYPTKRLNEITKIMVKSTFHRRLLPQIPDDKFCIIGHGVDAAEFIGKNIPRNRHQMVYTSSYDRGLENLLRVWSEVRAEIPDARLEIAYGWNLFDKMRIDTASKKWKEKMVELMKAEGITEHGRLSHQAIADLMLGSGVFAYPCHFEEIFCIAAAKAQMAGCVPVVGVSASCLDETVKIGVQITGDMKGEEGRKRFVKELVAILRDTKQQEEIGNNAIAAAQTEFDWNRVADRWLKEAVI